MKEKTLVRIKPDAFKRRKLGSIISICGDMGLLVEQAKMTEMSTCNAEHLYEHLKNIAVFSEVISFFYDKCDMACPYTILSGENVIESVRRVVGNTSPLHAAPGNIRFAFAENKGQNCVHASDSKEAFLKEVSIVAPDSPC